MCEGEDSGFDIGVGRIVGFFSALLFGMAMRVGGESSYRFGFNGKENDNEVKGGEGVQQDYGMRVYDPRLGRFLSVDPITNEYPELSPFQFASNSPILGVDLDGLEFYNSNSSKIHISLRYDPKIGIITNAITTFNANNIPDGLVTAINNANSCKDCIGSNANQVASFTFGPLNPLVKSAYGAEAKDVEIAENSTVGPFTKGSQTAIVPQNKKQAIQQERTRSYFTEGTSNAVGKFGLKMAALDIAASLLQWAANENIQLHINAARAQSANAASTTIGLLQKAINEGVIDKNIDEVDLTSMANYMLYGRIIEKRVVENGEVKYVKDEKLTQTAQKIFSDYIKPINEKKQKIEEKNIRKQKQDNTSQSGNGF